MTTALELVAQWRSIGPTAWAQSEFGWIEEDGKPITLLPWQRASLDVWWVLRLVITTLAISNVKKVGKTFIDAILLCWRWLALPGVHYACGNDLDQSAGRQFQMIAEMVKRHPYLSNNCEVTKNKITFTPTGSVIEALAVDSTGNAGANHLTVSFTECWGVLYEESVRAWEELSPPPGTKWGFPALRIADSYAGFEGESNTWHNLVDRGLKGKRVSKEWGIYQAEGLLLFHMEGEEARRRCFRGTREEAERYYTQQRADLRANAFMRQHDNKRTSNESAFILPEQWQACFDPKVRRWSDTDKRRLILGADASTSRDLSALVGVVWDDDLKRTEQVYCRVWKPERGLFRGGKPTVDLEETIGAEVLRLRELGAVGAIVYDPYQLHSLAISWERKGIKCIEMPQTAQRVESDQALYDSILAKTLAHCGDPVLTEHVLNAVAVETPRGFRLAKEKTSRKIDAAVSLSMATHAAGERGNQTGETFSMPFYSGGVWDGGRPRHRFPADNIRRGGPLNS